jgi:hypothetical protein
MNIWVSDRGVDNGTNSNENDGKIYELSLSDPPPPPDPGVNLLSNGDFEVANASNQPTDWSLNSRFTRSNAIPAHGGSFSGRHFSTANDGYKIIQEVPVTGGETYSFDGWVNAPTTTDAFKIVFKIQWRSSGAIGTTVVHKVTASTNAWTRMINNSLAAPGGATSARVMMVVSSLNATVYVDDFSFSPNT